jgi:uncharacterized protein
LGRRFTALVAGLVLIALGSVFMINQASLGLAPWDVLHIALSNKFGFTVGFWSTAFSVLFIAVTMCMTKRRPKLGTIMATILVGPLIDGISFLRIIPKADAMVAQCFFFIIGTLLFAVGTGMSLAADIGAKPRDEFMIILVNKTKMSVRKVRTILEVSVLLIGYALGGPVFIGTLFFSITIGPVAQQVIVIFRNRGG